MAKAKVAYQAKIISLGVVAKAVLMSSVILLLDATTFTQSLILVLVSATATGIFGLIIVLIQVHSDRIIHQRIDGIADKAKTVADTTDRIEHNTETIKQVVGDDAS